MRYRHYIPFLILTIFFLTTASISSSQILKFRPKLLSLRNTKVGVGIGLEGNLASIMNFNASKPKALGVKYDDIRDTSKIQFNYFSFGLAFDVYSANSMLGFLFGADYSGSSVTFEDGFGTAEHISIQRYEIPAYLKLRFGRKDATKHMWILLGGIYNITNSCKREQFDKNSFFSTILTDENKKQVINTVSLSAAIGYELFDKQDSWIRTAVYAKVTYPVSSYLNTEYQEFVAGGNGVLANYPGFDVRDYRVSIGVKFIYRSRH